MSTLVDRNVLIDVLSEDKRWFEWSAQALAHASERTALCINPVRASGVEGSADDPDSRE